MNMRAFFANFVGFQNHLVQNAAVVQISSAGTVWQIEAKGPNFIQNIKDTVTNWCNQNSMEVAVIRGKSAISQQRERICTGVADSIAQIFGIPKGKGKGKGAGPARITTCWPDDKPENSWRIIADSLVVVKGKIDLEQMRYEITLSESACNQQIQNLGVAIREWERADRIGYMLPVWTNTCADLSNCDCGRAPRHLQFGGAQQASWTTTWWCTTWPTAQC